MTVESSDGPGEESKEAVTETVAGLLRSLATKNGVVDCRHLELTEADLVDADLTGLCLRNADLSRADLTGADLSGSNLSGAKLSGARLSGATMVGAELVATDLSDADLTGCNAERAGFGGANLVRACLFDARLANAVLSHAKAGEVDLRCANLTNARLHSADLTGADVSRATLGDAELDGSSVQDATFDACDLRGARLAGLQGYESASWLDVDIRETDFRSAYALRRLIVDENYLNEFRTRGRYHNALYWLWWVTSDCGRSFFRWGLWTGVVVLAFAAAFQWVTLDFGDHRTFISHVYFSVVTLTTLGYGDILPASVAAQVVAMSEVIVGYVALGGLISILANKMARRGE